MGRHTLISRSSESIVDFYSCHPINWKEDFKNEVMLGEMADRAGMTPTPAIEAWIELYVDSRQLFTQAEYVDYCFSLPEWLPWIREKTSDELEAIEAKLYRNFFPSAVDSLHVHSMVSESGIFDTCFLDTYDDAIGKTDITVRKGDVKIAVGLLGPTKNASVSSSYKHRFRAAPVDTPRVEVQMDIKHPKTPGNKRWFREEDVISEILYYGLKKPAGMNEAAKIPGILFWSRRANICPVCNRNPVSAGVTCGSVRCTSLYTIGHISKHYWKDAAAELMAFPMQAGVNEQV